MKLVQLARPLFLMALGLHALVLFLPTGGESEAIVVEDVPFSEDSESAAFPPKGISAREALADQPLDQAPVPNPDALVIASRKAPKLAALSPVAVDTRTAAPRAVSAQAAPRRTAPATSTASTTSTSSSDIPNLPASSPDPSSADLPAAGSEATPSAAPQASRPSTGSVPDLSDHSGSPSATLDEDAASPSITTLIAALAESASVSDDLLKEVSDLSELLAYSEEDTDDLSASQNRADWKADIQRQANVGTVENIEPAEISDLTEIAYPIEVSRQADMEARSLSLCLEKAPHNAEVGVLFDAQGNVAGDPALLRSTGYEAINNEIIATVLSYEDFPPNRSSKAYLIEFDIDYDAETCVSLEALKE